MHGSLNEMKSHSFYEDFTLQNHERKKNLKEENDVTMVDFLKLWMI